MVAAPLFSDVINWRANIESRNQTLWLLYIISWDISIRGIFWASEFLFCNVKRLRTIGLICWDVFIYHLCRNCLNWFYVHPESQKNERRWPPTVIIKWSTNVLHHRFPQDGMFLLIMIMFQARGGRREVVQRSHPSGAGNSSVSKRSPFLCNLSRFMFIFLAVYSYSCLETISMPSFFRSGRTLRKSMRSSWSSGATSGRASFKKVKQISPHCCS